MNTSESQIKTVPDPDVIDYQAAKFRRQADELYVDTGKSRGRWGWKFWNFWNYRRATNLHNVATIYRDAAIRLEEIAEEIRARRSRATTDETSQLDADDRVRIAGPMVEEVEANTTDVGLELPVLTRDYGWLDVSHAKYIGRVVVSIRHGDYTEAYTAVDFVTGREVFGDTPRAEAVADICNAYPGMRAEIKELERRLELSKYVPGELKCNKCGFVMMHSIISASTGDVHAADTTTGQIMCPNDGEPMKPVDLIEALRQARTEVVEALKALSEYRRQAN